MMAMLFGKAGWFCSITGPAAWTTTLALFCAGFVDMLTGWLFKMKLSCLAGWFSYPAG
jgi:hypothetical protein